MMVMTFFPFSFFARIRLVLQDQVALALYRKAGMARFIGGMASMKSSTIYDGAA